MSFNGAASGTTRRPAGMSVAIFVSYELQRSRVGNDAETNTLGLRVREA